MPSTAQTATTVPTVATASSPATKSNVKSATPSCRISRSPSNYRAAPGSRSSTFTSPPPPPTCASGATSPAQSTARTAPIRRKELSTVLQVLEQTSSFPNTPTILRWRFQRRRHRCRPPPAHTQFPGLLLRRRPWVGRHLPPPLPHPPHRPHLRHRPAPTQSLRRRRLKKDRPPHGRRRPSATPVKSCNPMKTLALLLYSITPLPCCRLRQRRENRRSHRHLGRSLDTPYTRQRSREPRR